MGSLAKVKPIELIENSSCNYSTNLIEYAMNRQTREIMDMLDVGKDQMVNVDLTTGQQLQGWANEKTVEMFKERVRQYRCVKEHGISKVDWNILQEHFKS